MPRLSSVKPSSWKWVFRERLPQRHFEVKFKSGVAGEGEVVQGEVETELGLGHCIVGCGSFRRNR